MSWIDYKKECLKRIEHERKYNSSSRENLIDEIYEKDEEIQRLNNTIDELEKWLEEQREFIQTIDIMPNLKEIKLEHKIMFNDYNNVLDKLKALKEGKQ